MVAEPQVLPSCSLVCYADLVPIRRKRRWVPWSAIEEIRREAPLDPDFKRDVREWTGQTTDELREPWKD